MGFKDLDIKPEYRTKNNDVPGELIIPLLENSVSYKRAVGFFSSSALLEISRGLGALIKNGGRIQIVASPNLSADDIDAIDLGYRSRSQVLEDSLVRNLPSLESLSQEECERYNLLAHLIANDFLDFKIAFVDDGTLGIYHEKMAILEDGDGDVVAFTGSMNESQTGMVNNYGTVDVFKSWLDYEGRIDLKKRAFNAIWENKENGITTCDFPQVKDIIVKRYLVSEPSLDIDKKYASSDTPSISKGVFGYPSLPSTIKLRDYQYEAIDSWFNNQCHGLFNMATGTGKTITSLAAMTRLTEELNGSLAVIITCPYQHLVEQWVDDLKLFGVNPLVAYGDARPRDWKDKLPGSIRDFNSGSERAKFFCCITTNASLATDFMQNKLARLKGNVLFLADEAHNLGSVGYQKVLRCEYQYRLALSATFERHHDQDGTDILLNYFDKPCFEYSLEQAIDSGMLSPYKYYPIVVQLTPDEFDKYKELTKKLGKCFTGKKGATLNESGKIIAQQRARLVAAAENKLDVLKREISPYVNDKHILVYCGAASLLDFDMDKSAPEKDTRQITHVINLLGEKMGMRVAPFTSEENIKTRSMLKKEFSEGDLQALVAIKCLDEGVDIPSIKTAFMLASTTNPKEYIQRRGRLLRLSVDKEYAEIYDFITVPFSSGYATGQSIDSLRCVYTLMSNELTRAKEFSRLALNYVDAQSVIDELRENFRLDEIKQQLELLVRR